MMKNKKVLIVDDNALNRKVFENIIRHNYFFDTAENGLVALDKLKEDHFDVILMDIQMPKLDGISTLKIIKEEKICGCPIIAVSAYSDQSDRDYFLATGFDEFIAKPIKPKNLLETIEQQINGNTVASGFTADPPPESPHETTKDLDVDIVKRLLKYNSPENIREVYLDFIEEADELIADIKTCMEDKNYEGIGEKLHIIKGNSGTLGANKIYHFSAFFEKNIKSSKFDTIFNDYLQLKRMLENFRVYFGEQTLI